MCERTYVSVRVCVGVHCFTAVIIIVVCVVVIVVVVAAVVIIGAHVQLFLTINKFCA